METLESPRSTSEVGIAFLPCSGLTAANTGISDHSYNIVNAFTNRVLDLHGVSPSPDAWINIQPFSAVRSYNRWEFEIPLVGFPPGWFEIENVGSRDLLSQQYDHNTPVLLAPPLIPQEPQYRFQWQFQWTLSHSKCYCSSTKGEPNSWYIINRLTRAPLSPHCGTMAVKDFAGRDNVLAWKLELDGNNNWKIINRSTSCLLRQTATVRGGGTAVCCSDSRFEQSGGRQSWILKLVRKQVPVAAYTDMERTGLLCFTRLSR